MQTIYIPDFCRVCPNRPINGVSGDSRCRAMSTARELEETDKLVSEYGNSGSTSLVEIAARMVGSAIANKLVIGNNEILRRISWKMASCTRVIKPQVLESPLMSPEEPQDLADIWDEKALNEVSIVQAAIDKIHAAADLTA